MWARLAPLCADSGGSPSGPSGSDEGNPRTAADDATSNPPAKRRGKGRPKSDARSTLSEVLTKLRTGEGWNELPHGPAAHKLFRRLTKAGKWEAVWREVIASSTELGFKRRELAAATLWLLRQGDIAGKPTDWMPEARRLFKEAEGRTKRRERKKAARSKAWADRAAGRPSTPPKAKKGGDRPRKQNGQETAIWEIPDELWTRIEPIIGRLLPRQARGKARTDERVLLDGILFQLRTGCQWKALGDRHGVHYSTLHRWLGHMTRSGVFEALWHALAREAEALGLVDWKHAVIDGSLLKSRRGGECVGPNPADRGKTGIKWSLLVDGHGYPLAFKVAPANVGDKELLATTLASRLRAIGGSDADAALIVDRGYNGRPAQEAIEAAGYTYRAPPREDDNPYGLLDKKLTKAEKAIRARVERTHAWLQNYQALLTRRSRRKYLYEGQIQMACALLWWGRVAAGTTT